MMYREYLILFHLLGDCYFAYDLQYDDLPPLLGEMDPYLFQGGMPMDREVFDDWQDMCTGITNRRDLVERVIRLLESYEKKYAFDFADTKKVLANLTDAEIDKSIQNAEQAWEERQKATAPRNQP